MPKKEEEITKDMIPEHETKSIPIEKMRGVIKEIRNTRTGQCLFSRDPEALIEEKELGPEWIVK